MIELTINNKPGIYQSLFPAFATRYIVFKNIIHNLFLFFPLSKQMSCREISHNHNHLKIKKINSHKEKMLSKQPSHFEKSPSHFDRAHIKVPRIKIPDTPCPECQGYERTHPFISPWGLLPPKPHSVSIH